MKNITLHELRQDAESVLGGKYTGMIFLGPTYGVLGDTYYRSDGNYVIMFERIPDKRAFRPSVLPPYREMPNDLDVLELCEIFGGDIDNQIFVILNERNEEYSAPTENYS